MALAVESLAGRTQAGMGRATGDHRRQWGARTRERARWKQEDVAHQHSRRILNAFDVIAVDVIAVEGVRVTNLAQNRSRAKSLHDAVWRQFAALIAWKAPGTNRDQQGPTGAPSL